MVYNVHAFELCVCVFSDLKKNKEVELFISSGS